MSVKNSTLLTDIDSFLSETGMSASYLGKRGVGNSEIVSRLRAGRRIWPETETKLRSFMLVRLEQYRSRKRVSAVADNQGRAAENTAGAT